MMNSVSRVGIVSPVFEFKLHRLRESLNFVHTMRHTIRVAGSIVIVPHYRVLQYKYEV